MIAMMNQPTSGFPLSVSLFQEVQVCWHLGLVNLLDQLLGRGQVVLQTLRPLVPFPVGCGPASAGESGHPGCPG
jgi:hypothetical protein